MVLGERLGPVGSSEIEQQVVQLSRLRIFEDYLSKEEIDEKMQNQDKNQIEIYHGKFIIRETGESLLRCDRLGNLYPSLLARNRALHNSEVFFHLSDQRGR